MAQFDRYKIDQLVENIKQSIEQGNWKEAVSSLLKLRAPDQAGLFGDLPEDEQDKLLKNLRPEFFADILEELKDEEAAEVAARIKAEKLAKILDFMEPDEAADILGDLPPEQANTALKAMEDVDDILPLLVHTDESAGGIMIPVEVVFHVGMTVREAVLRLKTISPDSETIYYLFVVDHDQRLVGVVSLRQLIISPDDLPIEKIMERDCIYVEASADQEAAARLMTRYDLLALPVVNDEMQLIGIITHDDLVEVLEEEATEDIYRLGGVPEGQPVDVPLRDAMMNRLPWLIINLATAMISVVVLSLFEPTIARVAALAAFFPIVAGVSGSAGTQTLTVTVRGLALGELKPKDGLSRLKKEMVIGMINGLVIGLLVALVAFVWKGAPTLGLLIGLATLLNLISAGIAGVFVPISIQSLKLDPALASPILVTTATDTFGYFIYLGMATLMISYLV